MAPSGSPRQTGARDGPQHRITGTDSCPEALSYLPETTFEAWPHRYLHLIEQAAGGGVPVIASLNGVSPGGWTDYATAMQDAGAAAIELNIYSPDEASLPRTWIRLLRGQVRCSLAATTGVETAADVAAYLLAGADVVMTTSALLRHGPGYAADLLGAGLAVPGRTGYLSAIEQATHAFG